LGKHFLSTLCSALLLIAGQALAGSSLPDLPRLDDYLQQSEQAVADLRPDTEKNIIWSSEEKTRTPVSIVYLHGYSATRQESAPLSDVVARQLGANLFYTRLRGHGRDGAAMLDGTRAAWYEDVREAYDIGGLLGEQVVVISLSTGSTLATWLAAQEFADKLAAVVLISPNFAPAKKSIFVLDWPLGIGNALTWAFGDRERSWEPSNELHAKYWTSSYPFGALQEVIRLVKEVENIDRRAIKVPALMIYSPGDTVIDAGEVVRVYGQWGSVGKQLVSYDKSEDPSQHVLAGDILSPSSTEDMSRLILSFIQDHTRAQ